MPQGFTAKHAWYKLCRGMLRLIGVAAFQIRHTGMHNIPKQGPVLIAANHQSFIDPPLIGMGVPRILNYVARQSLLGFRPFDWLILSLNAIPLDQEGSALRGIKDALEVLKRGEALLIFPEGGRTLDGEIAPFLPGFRPLAVRGKATIVPTAIEGAYQSMPIGSPLPKPLPIHIHFGEPIRPEEFDRYPKRELVAEAERRVRQIHARLCRHTAFLPPGKARHRR
jgi:1-acyl-sn-glycerol-3-phosphate acyltransferase